jgi:hypothetical protein
MVLQSAKAWVAARHRPRDDRLACRLGDCRRTSSRRLERSMEIRSSSQRGTREKVRDWLALVASWRRLWLSAWVRGCPNARGSSRTASKTKEPVKIPSHTARRRVISLTIRLIILDPPCSFPTSVRIHDHPIPLVHVVLQEIRRKVTRKIDVLSWPGSATPATAATLRLQLIINHVLLITSYSGVRELAADVASVAAAALE